jgi:hypothetical protein
LQALNGLEIAGKPIKVATVESEQALGNVNVVGINAPIMMSSGRDVCANGLSRMLTLLLSLG